MRKSLIITLPCLALLLLTASCDRPRSTVEIVTGDFVPYTDARSEGYGTLTQSLTAALTGLGYRPRYRFVPFYSAKELATKRRVAGTFPWFVTDETRRNWIVVEQPLMELEYVFFGRRDSLQREGIDPLSASSLGDLDGLVFGGVKGYTYTDAVRRRIDAGHMFDAESLAFRALFGLGNEEDAVDIVQASREVGLRLIADRFAHQEAEIVLLDAGDLSHREPLYFLVNPNYPGAEELAGELGEELQRIRASGVHGARPDGFESTPRVLLSGPDDALGVPAYRNRDDDEAAWWIPHGSSAVVVRWADAFNPAISKGDDEPEARCRVRLLEEPARGRLVWIAGRYVRRGEDP